MKKGFTLVELLAVIAVLALIAAIAYPVVTNILQDMKENADESQKRIVIDAAKYWVSENDNLLSDTTGDIYTLNVSTLKEGEYITNANLRDLKKSNILNEACVKITTGDNKYIYEYMKKCQ